MELRFKHPLVVDLDRTFLTKDTALDDFIFLLKQSSFTTKFKIIIWFFKYKKSRFKSLLVELRKLHGKLGPYRLNTEFHRFLLTQRGKRDILLFTGANIDHASEVNNLYPYFDKVLASDDHNLITPTVKLEAIKVDCVNFDYAGDRWGDLKIFKQAQVSYVVNPTFLLLIGCFFYRSMRVKLFDVPRAFYWLAAILVKTSQHVHYPLLKG